MTSRRPGAQVYSTATLTLTGEMQRLERAPRRTPSLTPLQPTGARDAGGSIGAAFSLPSFANDTSTPPVAAPSFTPAPAPAPESDCCG